MSGEKNNLKILLHCILIIILIDFLHAQCALPCFAPPLDVSKNRGFKLSVSSKCGTPIEDFCVGVDCNFKCDASSNNSALNYGQSNMLDGYELQTYWKSKNFDEPVSIVFDLGSKMILHQITITFQYEFPNGLYIQKSNNDGLTYLTLMYYATRCNNTFENILEATDFNRLNVLCIKLVPSTNVQKQLYQVSEVHFNFNIIIQSYQSKKISKPSVTN